MSQSLHDAGVTFSGGRCSAAWRSIVEPVGRLAACHKALNCSA
ncbi:hypothetical protein [Frankia sp. R82]|nr:hypothetical protein [Frankia sp. R82]